MKLLMLCCDTGPMHRPTGEPLEIQGAGWAARRPTREVAEAALAHSAGSLARAYQRSDLLAARRKVMEAWGRYIT